MSCVQIRARAPKVKREGSVTVNMSTMPPSNPEEIRLQHLAELLELARRARSYTGDSRFSTINGKRVQVSE
jgi:hypothetical protein